MGPQCQCTEGFELREDGQTCSAKEETGSTVVIGGFGMYGYGFNCSYYNGGCEYFCNDTDLVSQRTGFNYECYCPPGLFLAPNGYSCHDINECNRTNPAPCADGELCVNTYKSYECLTLSLEFGEAGAEVSLNSGRAAGLTDNSGNAASDNGEGKAKMSNIGGSIGNTISAMQTSLIVMVVWVIIVTVALVTIGVLSFRRWRQNYFFDNQSNSSSMASSTSGDSMSDLANLDPVAAPSSISSAERGQANQGFDSDDDALSISVDMSLPETSSQYCPSVVSSSTSSGSLDAEAAIGTRL